METCSFIPVVCIYEFIFKLIQAKHLWNGSFHLQHSQRNLTVSIYCLTSLSEGRVFTPRCWILYITQYDWSDLNYALKKDIPHMHVSKELFQDPIRELFVESWQDFMRLFTYDCLPHLSKRKENKNQCIWDSPISL